AAAAGGRRRFRPGVGAGTAGARGRADRRHRTPGAASRPAPLDVALPAVPRRGDRRRHRTARRRAGHRRRLGGLRRGAGTRTGLVVLPDRAVGRGAGGGGAGAPAAAGPAGHRRDRPDAGRRHDRRGDAVGDVRRLPLTGVRRRAVGCLEWTMVSRRSWCAGCARRTATRPPWTAWTWTWRTA